jgi:hypothetical protein
MIHTYNRRIRQGFGSGYQVSKWYLDLSLVYDEVFPAVLLFRVFCPLHLDHGPWAKLCDDVIILD